MASNPSMRLVAACRPFARPIARTTPWTRSIRCPYSTETSQAAPPLLVKLKGDLKTAMKAKDKPRLSVLRSVLAATLNASKTASPIATDAQLVRLLRKTIRASNEAIVEFRDAGREDLVEQEEAQVKVLEEYAFASGLDSLGDAQLRDIVQKMVSDIAAGGEKPAVGPLMKKLLAPDGPLANKEFDKASLGGIAKEVVNSA